MSCPVADRRFTCRVPAGRLDLKLELTGRVPVYFWTVEADGRRPRDLGAVELRSGSSVSGRLEIEAITGPPGIELVRDFEAAPVDGEIESRLRKRRIAAEVDPSGFFQVVGVEPGIYRLRAPAEGAVPADLYPVRVSPDAELRLAEPVVLGPGAELEVYLDPPVTPQGEPWTVELLRETAPSEGSLEVVDRSAADVGGSWTASSLPAAGYFVTVVRDETQLWTRRRIDLSTAERRVLTLEIPVVPIEGSALSEDEPVVGVVVFGERSHGEQIHMTVDDAGAFEGYLPREGAWRVAIYPEGGKRVGHVDLGEIEIERHAGQEMARVDLELPDTAIPGIVVDTEGVPQEGARITAWQEKGGSQVRLAEDWSDTEVRFLVRGLPEGAIHFEAEASSGARSSASAVSVLEGVEAAPLTLVVAEVVDFEGVITVGGAPSGGAKVRARAADGALFQGAATTTDTSGRFHLPLPSRRLDVLIAPPNGVLALRGVAVGAPEDPPFAVDLAAIGGDLVIDLGTAPEPSEEPEARGQILLSHRGGSAPIEEILGYRTPTVRGETELVVPLLESGPYVVCQVWPDSANVCSDMEIPLGGEATFRPRSGPSAR